VSPVPETARALSVATAQELRKRGPYRTLLHKDFVRSGKLGRIVATNGEALRVWLVLLFVAAHSSNPGETPGMVGELVSFGVGPSNELPSLARLAGFGDLEALSRHGLVELGPARSRERFTGATLLSDESTPRPNTSGQNFSYAYNAQGQLMTYEQLQLFDTTGLMVFQDSVRKYRTAGSKYSDPFRMRVPNDHLYLPPQIFTNGWLVDLTPTELALYIAMLFWRLKYRGGSPNKYFFVPRNIRLSMGITDEVYSSQLSLERHRLIEILRPSRRAGNHLDLKPNRFKLSVHSLGESYWLNEEEFPVKRSEAAELDSRLNERNGN
jgi:hypothetical protein